MKSTSGVTKTTQRGAYITKYYSDDQIENEMGRACSMYGGEVHTGFRWGNLRERSYLEDPGLEGDNVNMNL